ncbi:patatin-like phospholipase family protein [Geomicrobium sp. JSM 1781026]|uniref:patatin-like phospholipase family protein n=1 Tax=Geomicrobium sp. JSM 1781026 TaxID=3344580 RepID=UPI0035C0AC89
MKADAVFEGGGIRGIAFAGAISAMEEQGVEWVRLAGTSVGSVVAALLAAGYTSKEIRAMLETLDYEQLRGRTWVNRIPIIGTLYNLLFHLGIYKNNYLESWVHERLREKGIQTFADLPNERLKIIASDITNGQMLVFPDDLPRYNMTPKDLNISKAILMSTSMPFFYRPVVWKTKNQKKSYIIDGGLLSNFPVWLFDVEDPEFPTFGFHFIKEEIRANATIPTPFHLFQNIFRTMMQAHDLRHFNENTSERTIKIDTGEITATDFELNREEMQFLYNSGYESARTFMEGWDFESHKWKRTKTKR